MTEHPEPNNLTDVAREIDAVKACNDLLRAAHLRAIVRHQRRAENPLPLPVEREP